MDTTRKARNIKGRDSRLQRLRGKESPRCQTVDINLIRDHRLGEHQADLACTLPNKCPETLESGAQARQIFTTIQGADLAQCVALHLLAHPLQALCHSHLFLICLLATPSKAVFLDIRTAAQACKCKTASSHHKEA